jgi:hypothetical protein
VTPVAPARVPAVASCLLLALPPAAPVRAAAFRPGPGPVPGPAVPGRGFTGVPGAFMTFPAIRAVCPAVPRAPKEAA